MDHPLGGLVTSFERRTHASVASSREQQFNEWKVTCHSVSPLLISPSLPTATAMLLYTTHPPTQHNLWETVISQSALCHISRLLWSSIFILPSWVVRYRA